MWAISKCSYLLLPSLVFLLVDFTDSVSINQDFNSYIDKRMLNSQHSLPSIFRVRRTYIDENENCGHHELEMVHTIMDRICMLCHELRSHFAPNTRVECRKDCFQNDVFQSCMKIFSAVPSRPAQHIEPTAPIPLYTENPSTLDDIEAKRQRHLN